MHLSLASLKDVPGQMWGLEIASAINAHHISHIVPGTWGTATLYVT